MRRRPSSSSPAANPCCHKDLAEIVEGVIARKKFAIVCTNALLLAKKIDQFKPSPYFTWSIHLDGDKEMHDHAVSQEGVYERAIEAVKLAKSKGFRVTTTAPSSPTLIPCARRPSSTS